MVTSTKRFLLLRQLFDQAVALAGPERKQFVAGVNDPELAVELRNLLAAHEEASSFIQTPAEVPPSAIPCEAPPPDNSHIGPYRVMRHLGGGGMGDVYLALRDDGTFRKYVAVKLIRKDLWKYPGVLDRFRAERQVLASLEHPNVARILDGGDTQDGTPYYVMEFIEGEPLDKYCDRKKLDIETRLHLFQQVVRAVHYLHTQQVVHRDLKPGNIFVTADGVPKLLDFGIAKILGPVAPDITGIYGSPLTPNYASPEQLSGRTVTASSDVYSLGVVLYLLLTGTLPDPLKITPPSAVVSNAGGRMPESETKLKRKVTGDLDKVVLKALERDPGDRYRTAEDLADDLGRYLDHRTVIARRASPVERASKFLGRNRIGVAVAVLVLILAMAAGWFGYKSFRTQSELERLNALAGQFSGPAQAGEDVPLIFRNLLLLRQNLDNPLLQADDLTPRQLQIRQSILQRSARYLDNLGRISEGHPRLALAVSDIYLRIGELQQSEHKPKLTDQAGAVASYTAAARQLVRLASMEPANADVRPRLADVERRLTRVEGRVPPEVVAILHPAAAPLDQGERPQGEEPRAVRTTAHSGAMPQPSAARPEPRPSSAATPAAAADPLAARPDLAELLVQVQAKVDTAEQVYQQLKARLADQGLVVRASTTEAYLKMRHYMSNASRLLDQGDTAAGTESLKIAKEYATRLLDNP